MRTIFHGFLNAVGRFLDFLCRPVMRRVEARVGQQLDERLTTELEARLVPTLTAALTATAQTLCRLDALMEQTNRSTRETDGALSLLLDEVNRLREQVESLQQAFPRPETDGEGDSQAELAIVDHEDFDDEAVSERARVG